MPVILPLHASCCKVSSTKLRVSLSAMFCFVDCQSPLTKSMAEANSLNHKRDRTGNLCRTGTQLEDALDYSGFRSHALN